MSYSMDCRTIAFGGTKEERTYFAKEWESRDSPDDVNRKETENSIEVFTSYIATYTYTSLKELSKKYPTLTIFYREQAEERQFIWTSILQNGVALFHDLVNIQAVDDDYEPIENYQIELHSHYWSVNSQDGEKQMMINFKE